MKKFRYKIDTKDNSIIAYDPANKNEKNEIKPYKIKYPYSQIFLTKEMERLKDIRENGPSEFTFPNLKYNKRFYHCMEAYYMMEKILKKLDKKLPNGEKIPKKVKQVALFGICVHDIGHGPGSHLLEKIFPKNHEERTKDILDDPDTEIHKVLVDLMGEEYIPIIEKFIRGEKDYNYKENTSKENREFNKYMKLIGSLTSNTVDADKLSYLTGDSYYSGVLRLFYPKDVIDALSITMDSNGNYIPTVLQDKISAVEAMTNFRAQMYRDVYKVNSDRIAGNSYMNVFKLYRDNPESVKGKICNEAKLLAEDPKSIRTKDFLKMKEQPLLDSLKIIKKTSTNPLLSYLADTKQVVKDTHVFKNSISSEDAKERLSKIFEKDLSSTLSVFEDKVKIKVKKSEESYAVDCGETIIDSYNSDMLLEPKQDILENRIFCFNPETLRIELDMTQEQFKKYNKDIQEFMEYLNRKTEEFELKYIVDPQKNITKKDVTEKFIQNGWTIVQGREKDKQNNDDYYDTKKLDLLLRGGSLRIRKSINNDEGEKNKCTYKMPTGANRIYSARKEIEVDMGEKTDLNNAVNDLKAKFEEHKIDDKDIENIAFKMLNSKTNRHDIVMQKDDKIVCISLDTTEYKNCMIADAP